MNIGGFIRDTSAPVPVVTRYMLDQLARLDDAFAQRVEGAWRAIDKLGRDQSATVRASGPGL